MKIALVTIIALQCSLFAAEKSAWPHFRGPRFDNTFPNQKPPAEFGPDKNLLWKTAIPSGQSSPVIAGDRMFVRGFDGKETLETIALSRKDGSVLWRSAEKPKAIEPFFRRLGTPAAPTCATDGERHVHTLAPDGGWMLLVGENGSGKSTAVDALRMLLAPRTALQHSFNDAAGGQKKKDRTLLTYVRGAWATQRDGDEADTAIQFLRKEETPSYLLAVFKNARRQVALTLAQILWVSNGDEKTVFLVGNGERDIAGHLQGLETGRGMKRELEKRGFDVRETYKAYREDFSARMGIPGEGALEIFNQAIGVKEVSDVSVSLRRNLLTHGEALEFIRKQVEPRFANLESCWNDIERAEKQIAMLAPVACARMLMLLIVGCIAFLFFAIATTRSELKTYDRDGMAGHPVSKFIVAGGVPILVAGVMTYVFVFEGGASTAQFNAGSPARLNVWRLWFSLFPLFLFLAAGSALGSLIWAVVCAARKSSRPNLGLAVGSCFLSVIAFFAVAENFPKA